MKLETTTLKNLIPVSYTMPIGWSGLMWLMWVLIRVNYNARRGGFKVKIEATFPMPWW